MLTSLALVWTSYPCAHCSLLACRSACRRGAALFAHRTEFLGSVCLAPNLCRGPRSLSCSPSHRRNRFCLLSLTEWLLQTLSTPATVSDSAMVSYKKCPKAHTTATSRTVHKTPPPRHLQCKMASKFQRKGENEGFIKVSLCMRARNHLTNGVSTCAGSSRSQNAGNGGRASAGQNGRSDREDTGVSKQLFLLCICSLEYQQMASNGGPSQQISDALASSAPSGSAAAGFHPPPPFRPNQDRTGLEAIPDPSNLLRPDSPQAVDPPSPSDGEQVGHSHHQGNVFILSSYALVDLPAISPQITFPGVDLRLQNC